MFLKTFSSEQMERVDGMTAGNVYFVDANNFVYVLNKRVRNKVYLRCRLRNFCPALTMISEDATITETIRHNHLPEPEIVLVCKFRSALRLRSCTENGRLSDIYREEELNHHEAALRTGGYRQLKSMMYRSRQQGVPRIPLSLVEYSQLLSDNRWNQRYAAELGPTGSNFYRNCLRASDNSYSVVFCSPTILQYVVANPVVLQMDATFKVVPRIGQAMQLFGIHVMYENTIFPLLYCLMERKSRAAYEVILNYLVDNLAPGIVVSSVMTDFESALRPAVATVLPGTRLNGCLFHFSRAVFQSRQLGIQTMADNQQLRTVVKMAMVLPLLPEARIAEGIDILEDQVLNQPIMRPFIDYLRRYWLPLGISVHGESHRTNNAVESYHNDLFCMVSRPHPNIWTFNKNLQVMEHAKACEFTRRRTGLVLRPVRRPGNVRRNTQIDLAQARLAEDGDVRHFLSHLGHLMGRLETVFHPDLNDADVVDQINIGEHAAIAAPLDIQQQAELPDLLEPLPVLNAAPPDAIPQVLANLEAQNLQHVEQPEVHIADQEAVPEDEQLAGSFCPVCLTPRLPNYSEVFSCGHVVCTRCTDFLMQNQQRPQCPVCRQEQTGRPIHIFY